MSFSTIQRLLFPIFAFALAGLQAVAQQETTDSAIKLAGLYLKLGQDDQCRAALDSILKANPRNVDALVVLGKLELKQGHHAAAVKAATTALTAAPDSIDATVVKARALALQGQQAEGAKLLKHVPASELDQYEDDLKAAGLRSANASTTTPDPAARKEEALDRTLEAARLALAKKELTKAGALTKSALATAPTSHDAIALRAEYLAAAGKADEAVALLLKLKAAQRPSKGPFEDELALGYALQDAGKLDAAQRSFEAVASSPVFNDGDRTQAREALAAMQIAKALTHGEAEMDAGHASKTLALAEEVLRKDPDNADAKVLQARARAATGHADEAVATLSAMKAKNGTNQHFDAQLDYAVALAADHRYADSVTAYTEVIRNPALYNADERKDAGDQLDDLRENHLAAGDFQVMAGSLEEGTLVRSTGRLFTARVGRTRWSAFSEWDHVKLDSALYPRSLTKDRNSSSITADTIWDDHWRTFIHAGGFDGGALGGATLDYSLPGGIILGLSADYNDPARDTLLLAAMDGRQHSLTANLTLPMGKHFVIESMLIVRQIEVGGVNIGHAAGTETQLRWHPVSTEDGLYFAYALEYKDFSPNDSSFDPRVRNFFGSKSPFSPSATDAVPDHVGRHALQAHASIDLLTNLSASALAEIAWRQETARTEYGAVAELLWRISDKASINARLEYYSGGSGPNAGAGVTMGTLGTKITW